ncbi:hypothetical protein [Xanthomonas cannabis]|uniref:hypothetical protein n=1 Tax=Xanthomonas cannabis TaxID=1885674 RepID=UPI000574C007|nr:hypothetical protein [Xanthomonas cannabis]KHL59312.1 hypothetical protein OZ13_02150 [Xanthomonas cannabis pv. cannabis]
MTKKLPKLYIMNIEQKIELLQKYGYTINGDEDSKDERVLLKMESAPTIFKVGGQDHSDQNSSR